jgi:TatD DNase family protein
MLIDSHCHLDLIPHSDIHSLITTAHHHGVSHLLSVGVELTGFPQRLAIAQDLDNVSISVGVHPNTHLETEPTVATLCRLADNPKVVAIGETGLDYFRSQGDLTWQHQRFRTHIQAAKAIGKPLIIHNREATADTLRILREEHATTVGGVMHCFVENWEIAQQVMDMGFYISFSGIVTFKSATLLQEVARKIPIDYMLIETDAPYLAPVPYRGQINQPAYVKYVAEFIANLREELVMTIGQATTQNFWRLFS